MFANSSLRNCRAWTHIGLAGCAIAAGSRLSAQTVSGRIFDSLAKAPVVGATVQLVAQPPGSAAPIEATSDNVGNYRFDNVSSGIYILGFYHALLDSIGIEPPTRRINVERASGIRVDLGIPSAGGLVEAVCRPAPDKKATAGLLVGHLYDASSRQPVVGGTVVAEWQRVEIADKKLEISTPQLIATTVSGGGFAFCGVPRDDDVMVTAIRGGDTTGSVAVHVSAAGFARRQLWIDQANQGRLTGSIVDGASHRPLAGAQVSVVGSSLSETTNDRGVFNVSGAPGGTQTILIRAVGYSPERRSVELLGDQAARVDVQMTSLRTMLDTIRVTARRLYSRDASGFEHRRTSGFGRFFDSTDVERLRPFETTRILQGINGVRLAGTGLNMRILMGNVTFCEPTIFVNGIALPDFSGGDLNSLVAPEDITGMEVYTSAGSTPAQYRGVSSLRGGRGCGSIVIWTKWGR